MLLFITKVRCFALVAVNICYHATYLWRIFILFAFIMAAHTLINFLCRTGSLTNVQADYVDAAFSIKDYKDGDEVFEEGKICKQFYFIESGILRIISNGENGDELTHYFYKVNQFCTILQSFNEQSPALLGIKAVGDTHLRTISKEHLSQLFIDIPAFKELVEKHNQERLLEKIQSRNDYQGQEAEAKYKMFLKHHHDIVNQVAVKDIASFIGITRQSLSRIRSKMQ